MRAFLQARGDTECLAACAGENLICAFIVKLIKLSGLGGESPLFAFDYLA